MKFLKPNLNNVFVYLNLSLELSAPNIAETKRVLSNLADAAKQYPADFVCPVLIPSA